MNEYLPSTGANGEFEAKLAIINVNWFNY